MKISQYGFSGMSTLLFAVFGNTEQRVACSSAFQNRMPNPLRAKAAGRMVYGVPVVLFMDDVSGNSTRQWNKHHVVYMSNGALPRQMLEKEFNVRFVSASPHASPMELMHAVKQSIEYASV